MIERRLGTVPTIETKAEANEKVDRALRYRQITEVLTEHPRLTAKQIAVEMWKRGWIPTTERNFVSPRLTELGEEGKVEPIGKTKCDYTGRMVTVWALCGGAE